MELARRASIGHAVRKRGIAVKCQVSFKYLSSITGRGATRSSELMHMVGCLRCFVSHSYTIAPAQKGILFRECGVCQHFPASAPANRNQWLFGHFILIRKIRKLRPM